MANTTTLNLQHTDTQSRPPHYTVRVDADAVENRNIDKVDAFAARLTASFAETVFVSGTVEAKVGESIGAYYTPINRVITRVVAFAEGTGSAGVTTVDVQLSASAGAGFTSIFANDAAMCNLSGAVPPWGLVSTTAMLTSSWPAGSVVRLVLAAAAAEMPNLHVHLFWKPSASYA